MTFSCADALNEVMSEHKAMSLKTRAGKTVNLRNLLLLDDKGLKTATVILKAFGDSKDTTADITEMVPQIRDLLLLVADKPADLTKEMDDWPLGMYMRVITEWQGVTELGEASESDS